MKGAIFMNRHIALAAVIMSAAMAAAASLGACSSKKETRDGGAADGSVADAGFDAGYDAGFDAGLPMALPFEYTRPDVGTPPTKDEVAAFTKKITGFWKQTDFFRWILRTSHGYDKSTGLPEWMCWQGSTAAYKTGDLVTFKHEGSGGGHNNWIPGSRVLASAIAAYLYTGDQQAGKVAEQYMKGLVATMKGFEYGQNDPDKFIMARAIVGNNHDYYIDDLDKSGKAVKKHKAVDYSGWRQYQYNWNTNTIPNPGNPYWGDLWVLNLRSKDDTCHITRTAAWLRYAVEFAGDAYVRDAAAEAWTYMQGFAKDIVDSGYFIRTKNDKGETYKPWGDQLDLANFVQFEIIDPNAECNAKLSAALLAYASPLKNKCLDGFGGSYETLAAQGHYYNYAIIRAHHQGAILNALANRFDDVALRLLKGLAKRIDDEYAAPESKYSKDVSKGEWIRDVSMMALLGASEGLPLTSQEARYIMQYMGAGVDERLKWQYWDLWDPSVPDGRYNYRPPDDGSKMVDTEDMAFLFEFCWSPFRNPATAMPVDCDVVRDPSRWGT
jgi:hypothetical protein